MAVEEANRLGFGVSYRRYVLSYYYVLVLFFSGLMDESISQPSFEWLLIDHFIVLGCKCHC